MQWHGLDNTQLTVEWFVLVTTRSLLHAQLCWSGCLDASVLQIWWFPYYEYVLVYVDDLLWFSVDPSLTITALTMPPFEYCLKDIKVPKRYLGAQIGPYHIDESNTSTWFMLADLCLVKALRTIEEQFGSLKSLFKTCCNMHTVTPCLPPQTWSVRLSWWRWYAAISKLHWCFMVGYWTWPNRLGLHWIYNGQIHGCSLPRPSHRSYLYLCLLI